MVYRHVIGPRAIFEDLRDLMAKATPLRSSDQLAGLAAASTAEDPSLPAWRSPTCRSTFLSEARPYEADEIARLVGATHLTPAPSRLSRA